MNFIQKAILRACWQEEVCDRHAPRPWLRRLLIHMIGMPVIPHRKSERIKMAKELRLALCKEQALRIDPEIADVFWKYGEITDPYGFGDVPEEEQCITRNYFARSPGSDVWVSFDDLPDATCDRLWARIKVGDFKDEDDLSWL